VWLAYLASATSTINLATGILIQPQRNPVVLAKEVATLDHLSGGRVQLGVGVGWLEEEFDAIGVPFVERGRRTDDGIAAMRALWSQDHATYAGEFTSFTDCICRPRPVGGRVPVHIGGHTEVAARRAGRIGDGFFPASGGHGALAGLLDVVRRTAEESGRDPSAIEITCGGNGVFGPGALDEAAALAELGVDRIVVPSFLFWKDTAGALADYGDEVIARV
jgi:probable F420-dependent oxidoreductase